MIKLHGFDYENVLTFKQAQFAFDQNLLYVRGQNLDSDPANPTSTGSGKTLLFRGIPNVAYFTNPMSSKKRSKKDLLGKGSKIGLSLTANNGRHYEIVQNSSSYKIYEEGNDIKIQTVALAEQYIRNLFPIHEIDFFSRLYISTRMPYRLQTDSDSERLDHFSKIFNLDQHDSLRTYFQQKSREVGDNEARIGVLEQQVLSLKRRIKEIQTDVTKEIYGQAKVRRGKLIEAQDKYKRDIVGLEDEITALRSLSEVEKKLDKMRDEWEFDDTPANVLPDLRKQRKAARAWETYDSELKVSGRRLDRIAAELKELPPAESLKSLRKELAEATDSHRALADDLRRIEEIAAEREELEADIAELQKKLKPYKVTEFTESDEQSLALAKSALEMEELIHEHEDGKCPTCNGDIDVKKITKMVKAARTTIETLESAKKGQKLRLELEALLQRLDSMETFKGLKKKYEALAEYESRIKELKTSIEVNERRKSLEEEHDELAKSLPEKPKGKRPSMSIDEIDSGIELCERIERQLAAKAGILHKHAELSDIRGERDLSKRVTALVAKQRSWQRGLDRLQDEEAALFDQIRQYETFVSQRKVLRDEYESALAEIDRIKPSLKDKRLYDILTKAYGAKGIRSIVAQDVCALYQQNLNEYAQLTFAEPFVFHVEASSTGIKILAESKNGKYDVRDLSGAESNCFRLASAAALEALTPDERKTNFIILDEPTSHMCPIARSMVVERYIPLLRQMFDHVIIITNTEGDIDPDSNVLTIVKENGKSRILEE